MCYQPAPFSVRPPPTRRRMDQPSNTESQAPYLGDWKNHSYLLLDPTSRALLVLHSVYLVPVTEINVEFQIQRN